jgi:hypothetical protein
MDITDIYDGNEPPKIRTLKYYLIALAIFLLAFVLCIGYLFHTKNTTRLVTFTLPADAGFYRGKELLKGIRQPGSKISTYACRLKTGKHKFRVIDSEKNTYPFEFEITENNDKPRSYIFKDGAFKSY